MALIDSERNALVLRIVFDGPPVAGKTATVRSLARLLGGEVKTPEAVAERTLWYDWMTYLGGRFDGRPILCQTVTVPGQAGLAARRRAILAGADVVVCVADTTEGGLDRSLHWYEGLLAHLAPITPAVPVIVQANKRDHHRAVPLDVVAARIAAVGGDGGVLTETNAMSGEGVRQTFVFAIRLALRRVAEIVAGEGLAKGAAGTAAELLGLLRALEDAPEGEPAAAVPVSAGPVPPIGEAAAVDAQRPALTPAGRLERMNLRGLLAFLRNDPTDHVRGRAS
ncbi:MAG TPA: GTPase domain-containing protein [Acidimicrobiales bacterium]|nr:GTPase domain-containing protein [Acidimicrobiales bacterium]